MSLLHELRFEVQQERVEMTIARSSALIDVL